MDDSIFVDLRDLFDVYLFSPSYKTRMVEQCTYKEKLSIGGKELKNKEKDEQKKIFNFLCKS